MPGVAGADPSVGCCSLEEAKAEELAALLQEIAAADEVAKVRDEEAAARKRAELEAEEQRKAAEAEKRRAEEAAKVAKEEVCERFGGWWQAEMREIRRVVAGRDGAPFAAPKP